MKEYTFFGQMLFDFIMTILTGGLWLIEGKLPPRGPTISKREAAKSALGIKSPSKEFAKVGLKD